MVVGDDIQSDHAQQLRPAAHRRLGRRLRPLAALGPGEVDGIAAGEGAGGGQRRLRCWWLLELSRLALRKNKNFLATRV